MFGRKRQALTAHNAPLPQTAPEAQVKHPGPLPRRCPLTQSACRDACAWMVEGECAATFVAREMFTLVEVLARSQRSLALPLGEGDPSPNRSPAASVGADGNPE